MSIKKLTILTAYIFISLTSACTFSPMTSNNGHFVSENKIEDIIPGKTTKRDIIKLLGTPGTKTLFNEERWLYISNLVEAKAFFAPKETKRDILQVSFNSDETVKEVKIFNKEDGKEIIISEDKTPTTGHELKAIEQLIGNLGRFENKGQTLNPL